MILRHRDRELLRFEWNGLEGVRIVSVNEAEKQFLPLEMRGEATDERLWEWLRHRVVPKHRSHILDLLAKMDVRYSVRTIIEISRGLSLNDVHWVASDGSKAKWSKVNKRAYQIVEFGEDADKLIYIAGKSGTVNSANGRNGGAVDEPGFFGGDESLAFQVKANLKADPFITRQELSQILGVPLRTLSRRLKRLQDGGGICREGSDKKGYWRVLK